MAGVKGRSGGPRPNSGGARPGAGRKPLREKYEPKINQAEKVYSDYQEQAALNLQSLAQSSERIEEEFVPAGTVMVDAPLKYPNGEPIIGPGGKAVIGKVCAFPDLPAEQMVAIKRKVVTLPPDREANIYITDRIQGKPVAAIEAEVTGESGGPLNIHFENSLTRVYGDDNNSGTDADETSGDPADSGANGF